MPSLQKDCGLMLHALADVVSPRLILGDDAKATVLFIGDFNVQEDAPVQREQIP